MKNHNPELTYNARELRKNMTTQETRLWYNYLRTYPYNFLKQKVIGNYIVDFYCPKVKLAIEIDGEYHNYSSYSKETIRTEQIKELGIELIRIPNSLVDDNFEKCCDYIDNAINNRINKIV